MPVDGSTIDTDASVADASNTASSGDNGCNCTMVGPTHSNAAPFLLTGILGLWAYRRRRDRR